MLSRLRTGFRFRLALAFALFAAFCFVAPPAVLAFGHGANTLDCLAHADVMNHGKGAKSHDIAHHGGHSPASDHSSPDSDHDMTCCGLFCLSALATECGAIAPRTTPPAAFPARDPNLLGRVAERLDRPPIFLLV
jgi:hypothetical protein